MLPCTNFIFILLEKYSTPHLMKYVLYTKSAILFFHNSCFLLAERNEPANALMKLNQLRPGTLYKLASQTGPEHEPQFTMAVEVDGVTYEATGPSKRSAKLHVAQKVSQLIVLILKLCVLDATCNCYSGNSFQGCCL